MRILLVALVLFIGFTAPSQAAQSIAVFGDSLADGVWAGLYQEVRHDPGVTLYRDSKVGTGMTRPDYETFFNGFAATLGPDKVTDVVVMFGANDEEGLRGDDHKGYMFQTPGWQAIYAGRIKTILSTCAKLQIKVYWIGLPVLRDPVRNQGALYINGIVQSTVTANGGVFVPLEDVFKGPDGGFVLSIADAKGQQRQLRAEDGVHFTFYGYDLIAKRVLAAMPAAK